MNWYIRKCLGGRRDAWDGCNEWTRVDEVLETGDPWLVKVCVEGRWYYSGQSQLIQLVELEVAV